ncbi:hypothetical protein AK830_g7459 [Neonectria ditissima]|uniref:Peptidase S54 rhomboid domain-containing protein n=1 Tax=Neonectria ditissima TaxID=78410 RepID=A0A0P7AMS4_9HYPO|nr:hypothetical protein AK830_g7459 [Neonectria ditissima]
MLPSPLSHLRPEAPNIKGFKRSASCTSNSSHASRLRIAGPIVWCLAAAGTFYLGCAGWEVYQDAKEAKKRRMWPASTTSSVTHDQLEAARAASRTRHRHSGPILEQIQISSGTFSNLAGADKMVAGAIGLNTVIHGICRILPGIQWQFAHVPAGPFNYTLLTSMFGHAGLLHLGANMYGLYNFAPAVAQSRVFERSGAHLTAFYLSAGVFASLASHLTSKWASPRALRSGFLTPGLGASGAIFGVLGAWAMLFPDAHVGILLLPGRLPADEALVGIALFETYGLAVGFKSLNFGHAAHLAGLTVGAGYVYFDGNRRLWKPARRFMFNQMKRLGVV